MSTIGERMKEGQAQAIRGFISFAGILVYLASVLYAEAHNYAMMVKGIDPELLVWAIVGIFALGITAIALPTGLHFTFHDPKQRLMAWFFYGLDLALLIFNAVIDYLSHAQGAMPSWGKFYLDYVVPANPMIVGLGWSILLLLDPAQRMRAAIETLKAATQEAVIDRISEAAKAEALSEDVDQQAIALVETIVAGTLASMNVHTSGRLPAGKPRPVLTAKATDREKKRWSVLGLGRRQRPAQPEESANGSQPDPTKQRQA